MFSSLFPSPLSFGKKFQITRSIIQCIYLLVSNVHSCSINLFTRWGLVLNTHSTVSSTWGPPRLNAFSKRLRAILNTSWRQHPRKQQLYGRLTPITKTIQVRRTRHAGHSWRSWDERISDILTLTPSHGRPTRTYIQKLCADTGCTLEDLPEAMDDREGWWESVREIHADGAIWWWWRPPLQQISLFR